MTKQKKLKRRIRERMAKTGESYHAARHALTLTTPPGATDAQRGPEDKLRGELQRLLELFMWIPQLRVDDEPPLTTTWAEAPELALTTCERVLRFSSDCPEGALSAVWDSLPWRACLSKLEWDREREGLNDYYRGRLLRWGRIAENMIAAMPGLTSHPYLIKEMLAIAESLDPDGNIVASAG